MPHFLVRPILLVSCHASPVSAACGGARPLAGLRLSSLDAAPAVFIASGVTGAQRCPPSTPE
jgi:hypothetical protein